MAEHTIDIDFNKKCTRCKKRGATPSGYCLSCISKRITEGKYDHILKKHGKAP